MKVITISKKTIVLTSIIFILLLAVIGMGFYILGSNKNISNANNDNLEAINQSQSNSINDNSNNMNNETNIETNDVNKKTDKLIATKNISASESEFGQEEKEIVELIFDSNEELINIKMTWEFDTVSLANEAYSSSEVKEMKNFGLNPIKDGKKIIVEYNPKSYGVDFDGKSKEDIKKEFQNDGYSVK